MKKNKLTPLIIILFVLQQSIGFAQKKVAADPNTRLKEQTMREMQDNYETYKKTALQIWDYAEVGYKETKSSALLQQLLRENGFVVEAGVAEIPTAFVASYGTGKPVIAILRV